MNAVVYGEKSSGLAGPRAFQPASHRATPEAGWKARSPRRGASLISVIFALTLTAVALAMMLQGYTHGARFNVTQERRAVAFAAAQSQMETLRAGGYHALPTSTQTLPLAALPGAQLRTEVAPGPVADTRRVTVTASWPAEERAPAGRVELATIFAARGRTP